MGIFVVDVEDERGAELAAALFQGGRGADDRGTRLFERTAQLPVMDHRNKPISNPDSFQVNTAMQRCLAKAIALHGLGLYIYQGEDLPVEDSQPVAQVKSTHVSASEVAVIEKLAGLAGVKHQAILDKFQVGSLAQIEKKYLDEIVKKLQQRISEKDERKAA